MSDTPRTDAFEQLVDRPINWWDFARQLERENAALREALVNADELERYSGSDGHRQWGKCSAWLHPDDSKGAAEWSLVWNPAPTAEAAEAATEDLPINIP